MTRPVAPPPASPAAATKPAARSGLGWVGIPVAIFAILAGLFALSLSSGDPSKLPSALIGKPAPMIELAPLAGLAAAGKPVPGFSTAQLGKGRVTVVNFWASWCVPCVQEHPFLITLAKESDVSVYGVNYKDQTDNALRFLGNLGNPYAAVGVDAAGRAAIEWGVYGMPETFVVDSEGRIAYKQVGPIDAKNLAERIRPAIAKAQAGAAKR